MNDQFASDPRSRSRHRRSRRVIGASTYPRVSGAAVATFLVAAGLFWLAVPRAMVAFRELPANHILQSVRAYDPVSIAVLNQLIQSRQAPAPGGGTARSRNELASAYVEMARAIGTTTPFGRSFLVDAREEEQASLAQSPGNGFGWARLAHLEMALAGPSEQVLRYLQLSFETARFEPRLMVPRLLLAFALRAYWGQEFTDLMLAQVRMAWSVAPEAVAQLSVKGRWTDFARSALGGDADRLRDYDARVTRL